MTAISAHDPINNTLAGALTVFQVAALAMSLGFGPRQSEAVAHFAWRAQHLDRTYTFNSPLNECGEGRYGLGIVDTAGPLRRELRAFANIPHGCIPARVQLEFLRDAFPRHLPCAYRRFLAGDVSQLQRAWGNGREARCP